jgi:ATP-binding cassette subfamily G (WHITE) protein 2 (SNQ2)
VSIAEAMITRASSQFYDNSTKGLDASSAREYVEALRVLTNMTNICTMAALYQVGESLYELFDKVLVMDGGKCAYFGDTKHAVQYFKDLGFESPDRWTSADFLTSVFDQHERQIAKGSEGKVPRSAAAFSDTFRNSEQAKKNKQEVEDFEGDLKGMIEERHKNQTKHSKKKNYTISWPQQVMACTRRQALIMLGDPQSTFGKWAIILFQSFIVGSLFYSLPKTSAGVFQRGGVIFYMLLFNSLLALAELTSAFQSRPILLKHKSFSFYRPSAYAIAQVVIDVPLVFVQVFIFDLVVYMMADLQRTASQFFISLLFLFTITMTIYSLFRAFGSVLPSLDAATRVTGVAIQALIVYTG